MTRLPILKEQEIPHDDPESCCMFQPSPEKPLVATQAAIATYSLEVITKCYELLRAHAERHQGLDYLQVFQNPEPNTEDLWFIEDGEGGAITALLPSDY
jgi:hypothetical protein